MSSPSVNPVALITGGTAGIGLESCKELAAQGIDVILTSRSEEKGKAAVEEIKRTASVAAGSTKTPSIEFIVMELSSLKSVSDACQRLKATQNRKLDYILLNAGIMGSPTQSSYELTADGIETIVAVNHVAGTYLALELLPVLEKTATVDRPMITFVSSDLHNLHSITGAAKTVGPIVKDESVRYLAQNGNVDGTLAYKLPKGNLDHVPFVGTWAYKFSKLLNVLTATSIHQHLAASGSKVSCNSMEPGFIPASELSREIKQKLGPTGTSCFVWCVYHAPLRWLLEYMLGQPVRTLKEGGSSEVYALTKGEPGKYYRLDEVDTPSPLTEETETVADKLFEATMALLKEKGYSVTM